MLYAEIPLLKVEREVYHHDEHRHFDERADDRGEGHLGLDAEHGHCHGDGQLEVIG